MADLNDLTQNVNIWDDDKQKSVTVTTDGAKQRLDVEATLVAAGGQPVFSLQPFVPVMPYNSAGQALTTSWTTLLDYSGTEGKLDFIAAATGTSNYKIRLTIDTVEVFDISMADLNAIGLTNAVNVNIWAETALKNFRYRPLHPIDFVDSIKVEAAMTTGTGTMYWLINYRTISV